MIWFRSIALAGCGTVQDAASLASGIGECCGNQSSGERDHACFVPVPFGPNGKPSVILDKAIHGGETHHCVANLKFTINGVPQIDPVNATDTFHPQFR